MADKLSDLDKDDSQGDKYNSRPKEQFQILESNSYFFDILYNEKLNTEWIITVKTENKNFTVKEDDFIDALNKAEDMVLDQ